MMVAMGKLFIQCSYDNYNNNNERERPSNIMPKGIRIKGVSRGLHSPLHTKRKTDRLNTKLKYNHDSLAIQFKPENTTKPQIRNIN